MVAGDGEDDAGRVLGPVVVGRHRVMDERDLDLAEDRGLARRDAVAAPRGARDDRRRRAGLGGARLRALQPAGETGVQARGRQRAHEAGAQVARGAAQAELELVRGADERGVRADGELPPVGAVVAGGVEGDPVGPAAAAAAGAQLRLGARSTRPAQADHVEAARRAQDAARAPAGGGGAGAAEVDGHLEQRVGPRGDRRGGGPEPDHGCCGGSGFEDLPAGVHDLLQHGDGRKGP